MHIFIIITIFIILFKTKNENLHFQMNNKSVQFQISQIKDRKFDKSNCAVITPIEWIRKNADIQ